MFRILSRVGNVLCVLLLCATLALWIRSRTRFDQLTVTGPRIWVVRSNQGKIVIERIEDPHGWFNVVSKWTSGDDRCFPIAYSRQDYFHKFPLPIETRIMGIEVLRGIVHIFVDESPLSWPEAEKYVDTRRRFPIAAPARIVHGAVPYWLIAGFASAPIVPRLTSLKWKRIRIIRRRRAGLCVDCGYNLRTTPNQCPECGSRPDSTVASAQQS
jgi:hypothetical protein